MEKWIFLGTRWQTLSPLRQFALSFCAQKACYWASVMSVTGYLGRLWQKAVDRNADDSVANAEKHGVITNDMPLFVLKFWLKKQIAAMSGKQRVVIVTDNPRFHKFIGTLGRRVIWVYVRPACRHCAAHVDSCFMENDALMTEKATLIVCSEKGNIPATHPSLPQEKVISVSRIPLVSGEMKNASVCERIAGFCGPLDAQVNVELIVQAAMAMPSWVFEVYVTHGKPPASLEDLPNIILKKLPDNGLFFSRWDVALLPYVRSLTHGCHSPPMLTDYIRYGVPVAVTALPDLRNLEPPVIVQRLREPFVTTIRRALDQPRVQPAPMIDFDQWWRKAARLLESRIDFLEE